MSETPRRDAEARPDHTVVQVSRRAVVARARFERELDALIEDLHAIRETIHGHPLPYEQPPAEQQEHGR